MRNTEEEQVIRVTQFLVKHYPFQSGSVNYFNMVSNWIKNTVVVDNDEGDIVGVAIYMMVDDVAINRMADGLYKPWYAAHFKEIVARKGDNLHFWLVACTQGKALTAGLQAVWQQVAPKSISYFKPDMKTFVYMPRGG